MGIKDILDILQNHVKYVSGVFFLGLGGGLLVLIYRGHIEQADVPPFAKFFLWLFLVAGSLIIILKAAQDLFGRAQRGKLNKQNTLFIAQAKARHDEELLSNLSTLDEQELFTFVWLLRNGQKRFGYQSEAIRRLSEKRVAQYVGGHNAPMYEIADIIWDKRDELLQQNAGIRFTRAGWPQDGVFYRETRRR